ncbi:homoserine dehydrogenase-like protein [Patellaria atrata CBS 101060]|uniref:Homoserine dehydrogenase n=1 Tax=Patellaria atrata CBS 101060 TaxID=1346257 RepID=A0A9P4SK73_9PEZI|nr:homoserine dehydrogenase-like protein [Patellaria atrata CBS 101060]
MAPPRQIFIAVIGAGGVGKCFLSQLSALAARQSQNPASPTYFSLIYLSTSKKLLCSSSFHPLSLSNWESDLAASTTAPFSPTEVANFLSAKSGSVILVDNTSNQDIADTYPLFLKKGISVVTPNKKAFSSDLSLWKAIYSAAANGTGAQGAGYVFHESSVGAGLPVISTLKELVETGDHVRRIEGVFSGTMSFLFNSFMPVGGGGGSFSAEVKKAKDLGYTEPDPRDDLNGLDVARKLTILARLAGLEVVSPTSFPVQSLIPKELEGCLSGDEFLQRLGEFDGEMDKLKKETAAEGKVVRFVGSIDITKNEVNVGMEKFDTSHPIATLKGSDNIISFYTERYGSNPLIIQGAGAGGEVTAMGATGDFIKVLRLLH